MCYEEKLGTQCVRLEGCRHVFCEECVATHAQMHVREGTLERLQCLDGACHTRLPRQVRPPPARRGSAIIAVMTWPALAQ